MLSGISRDSRGFARIQFCPNLQHVKHTYAHTYTRPLITVVTSQLQPAHSVILVMNIFPV